VTGSIISHLGSGITPGSYTALTVDTRGHIVSGSNPVLDHAVNITNVGVNTHSQIDSDLLRLVNTTGSNTGDQIVPQNKPQLLNQYFVSYNATTGSFTSASVTSTGSVAFSASGVTPISVSDGYIVSHDDSGVVSGSYNAVFVDAKGHITAGSNVYISSGSFYTGSGIIDVSGSIISHGNSGVVSGSYNAVQVDACAIARQSRARCIDYRISFDNVP
jgi:hypothetical protein